MADQPIKLMPYKFVFGDLLCYRLYIAYPDPCAINIYTHFNILPLLFVFFILIVYLPQSPSPISQFKESQQPHDLP